MSSVCLTNHTGSSVTPHLLCTDKFDLCCASGICRWWWNENIWNRLVGCHSSRDTFHTHVFSLIPEFCPNTFLGSPPNEWLFLWSHFRAVVWSMRPWLPVGDEGGRSVNNKNCFDVALFPPSHFFISYIPARLELNLTLFKLRGRGNGAWN